MKGQTDFNQRPSYSKFFGVLLGLFILLAYGFLKTGNINGINLLISYISRNYIEFGAILFSGLIFGVFLSRKPSQTDITNVTGTGGSSYIFIGLIFSLGVLLGYSFYFKKNIVYVINLIQLDPLRFGIIYLSGLIIGYFLFKKRTQF